MASKCLLLCLLFLKISWSIDPNNYPHILSKNNNLIIRSANNKNITFQIFGELSFVNIGDINLNQLLEMVLIAAEKVENLETTLNNEMDMKYQKFSSVMTGKRGVQRRLVTLETKKIAKSRIIKNIKTNTIRLSNRLKNLENDLKRNECASSPCKNNGKCIDGYKKFICLCPKTWQGSDCSLDVNECDRFARTDLGCQNGATCINNDGGYQCICPPQWYGIHCTKRSTDCGASSDNEMCGHGVCINGPNQNSYTCICDQGWETNGITPECTVDVNECLTANHHCSLKPFVPCFNIPGSFYCGSCPIGYSGNGYVCNDIDECLTDNGGCSTSPLVRCINTLGSRVCDHCPPGYAGDGTNCTFKGICQINNGGCHPLATCSDNPSISSTYVICTCAVGYTGTGYGINGCVISSGFNPSVTNLVPNCNSIPCIHGRCVDMPTGLTCICDAGYTGHLCDAINDPCASQPCENGGTCIRDVTKDDGFRCECTSEYTPPRCVERVMWCGGIMEAEEGSIIYPKENSTTYKHNTRCTWVIKTKPNKVLNLTFTKFDLENSIDCLYDWIQIHDGRNTAYHIIGRFCGNTLPHGGNIISTSNYLYLWFRADHTIAHQGFRLHWVSIDPVCGGKIESSSYGTLSSPGSPGKYPPNRDCYWTITTDDAKRIQIHFFTLQIESQPNCISDFLEIRDGDLPTDPVLAKYCNSTIPPQLLSSGNHLSIHFHSDGSNNDYGFKLSYAIVDGIPGCGGIYTRDSGEIKPPMIRGNYANNVICEYKIQLPRDTQVKIIFLAFNLEQSIDCRYDYIAIYDGKSKQDNLIGRYCGTDLPTLFTSNSNNLLIVFKSDWSRAAKGFHIRYELICHQVFTALSGTLSSPGYPKPYLSNKRCTYLIRLPEKKAIVLSFVEFEIEPNSYPNCKYDKIEIFDGDDENSNKLGKYCGGPLMKPDDIISSLNYLYLQFNTDASISGSGFVANYTSIDIDCGSVLKNSTGIVSIPDPNYISIKYKTNLRCQWVISLPSTFNIQLTWSWIYLDSDYQCSNDYIEIYENYTLTKQSSKLGRFCGLNVLPIMTSSSNLMTIIFKSNSFETPKGFSLSYNQIDVTKVCGGNYFASSGTITSPGWPKRYPEYANCSWTIQTRIGQQIMLNFKEFNMSTVCSFDYLEVKNGINSEAPLIGKFCNSVLPKTIISFANNLYLHFQSGLSKPGGFQLTWDTAITGCGGILTSAKGKIISPNYPQPYGINMECYYKILTSVSSQIKFNFIDLQLGSDCSHDYVEIFNSPSSELKSLGKFCNIKTIPETLISPSNHVFVKFHSGLFIKGTGFSLNYETSCNVTLTGHNGVIESPNFPNSFDDVYDCFWQVVVPKGNKIKIIFSHLELENTDEDDKELKFPNGTKICSYDYVEIKEDIEQNFNERLCGKKIPPRFTTKNNQVTVHFKTDGLKENSGFRLEWTMQGCGEKIFKLEGTLKTPDYPKSYPKDIECIWDIKVPTSKSIQLEIEEIDFEFSENCTADSLSVYNGQDAKSPLLTKVCYQHQRNIVVTSTGNYMHIHFISDGQYSGKGFMANFKSIDIECGGEFSSSYGIIQSPNYPLNCFPNAHCYWQISVPENHRAMISFDDFYVISPNGDNCTDVIRIYDGNKPDDSKMISKDLCGNFSETFFVSNSHQMLVEMITRNNTNAKGFQATYSLLCGYTITAETEGFLKIDGYSIANQKFNSCIWTIIGDESSKIALTFMYLNIDGNSKIIAPKCEGPKIVIYNGESVTSPVIQEICDNKIPPTTLTDGNAITIELKNGRGIINQIFEAHYSTLSNACGGELKSEHGTFTSPMYPSSYPLKVQCIWILKPSPGNQVRLSILKFDLEESEHCNKDYLEIRENDGMGKNLGIYCGNTLPTITTSGKNIWIKFNSDSDGNYAGFVADYSYIHGNELSGEAGIITSPMYPKSYDRKSIEEFSWRITVSFGSSISLVFKELKMANYDYCEDINSVVIYDGYDNTAPVMITACGHDLPEPVETTSNVVYILFRSSGGIMGSLFQLEWTRVTKITDDDHSPLITINSKCGRPDIIFLPISSIVSFTSPGFPEGYAENLKCQWVFETDPTHHVGLQFLTMDLEKSDNCFVDNVIVSTTSIDDPNDWVQLDKFCLENATDVVVEGNNKLKIEFNTDITTNFTGFKALAFSVCGGYLTSPTGILSPSVPNNTQHMIFQNVRRQVSCVWSVKVRPGRTIRMKFLELNSTDTEAKNCRNYVMLRNGASNESPILGNGKYCGDYFPDTVFHTISNRLYVEYNSDYRYPVPPSFQSVFNFKIEYWEISSRCEYQLKLTDDMNNTIITSPNYPKIPKPYSECVWVITAPIGEKIKIDFIEKFYLIANDNCESEYVEVRDGGTDDSVLIGKFCGNTPSFQKSSGNIIYIKFATNTDDPGNGFKALISIDLCGGTIYNPEGRTYQLIRENLYMANQNNDIECIWKIYSAPGTGILMDVHKLFIPDSNNSTEYYFEMTELDPFINTNSQSANRRGKKIFMVTTPTVFRTSVNAIQLKLFFKKKSMKTFNYDIEISINATVIVCNAVYRTPEGIISSPKYMNHNMYDFYCMWSIIVPVGRRITLEIISGVVDKQINENNLRIEFSNSISFNAKIPTNLLNTTNRIVESSSNKMNVYYWVRIDNYYEQFKAKYTSNKKSVCDSDFSKVSGIITPPTVFSGPYICEYQHIMSRNTLPTSTFNYKHGYTFAVTLSKLTINRELEKFCNLSSATITIIGNLRHIEKFCRNYTDPVTMRFITDRTSIMIHDDGKGSYQINYQVNPCGGMIRNVGSSYRIIIPNILNHPIDCAWYISPPEGYQLEVNMTGLKLTGDCNSEYLLVRHYSIWSGPMVKFCANNISTEIISPDKNVIWIEYSADRYYKESKLGLQFNILNDGCGVVSKYDRTFSTSKYPSNYEENDECIWNIVAQSGYRISLNFIDRFSIEKSPNCTKDFVEILDFDDKKWISMGKYCGREISGPFNSTSNKMTVNFRSDSSISGDGFKAHWEYICGGEMYADIRPKYITSPGYPKYKGNLNCVYKIIGPPGKFVQLNFENFNLEDADDKNYCKFDNITVETYDRNYIPTNFEPSDSQTFCGNNNPGKLRLKNGAKLTFKTDMWTQNSGFILSYKIDSCGGDINSSQKISSPNDKGQYHSELNCIWNITAPPDKVVIVRFQSFVLEQIENCQFDHVTAFDGIEMSEESKLGTFCGNHTKSLPVIKSKSNNMILQLVTDSVIQFSGFVAEVYFMLGESSGCGGTINLSKDNNYVLKINKEHLYKPNMDCHWLIRGPTFEILQMTFDSFHVAPCQNVNQTDDCNCDYLEIRDGIGQMSPLIGKYCGHWIPNRLMSFRNSVWIRFVTDGAVESSGVQMNISTKHSPCNDTYLTVTDVIQTLKSPINSEGFLTSGISCLWHIRLDDANTIHLNFLNFELSPPTPDNLCLDSRLEISRMKLPKITDDKILIFEGEISNKLEFSIEPDVITHIFCGFMNLSDYYVYSNELSIKLITSLNMKNKYKGFELEYEIGLNGRNFTAHHGSIIMSVENSCTIFISTTPDRWISIYFDHFEGHYYSKQNYLEIKDGLQNDSVILSTIDSSRIPFPVFSTGNILRLDLYKNDKYEMLKLNAYYVTTDQGRGCGGFVNNIKGIISSPLYPIPYRTAGKCLWIIETPYQTVVSIKFKVFDLSIENSCEFNYVKLINHNGGVIAKYCPGDSPAPRQSNKNYLKIEQSSSNNNKGYGWLLDFEAKAP